jgi:hypothetical protein
MSVNYDISTINGRLAAVITHIDAGSSVGNLRLLNNLTQTVSLIPLQKPSGIVGAGVLTFAGLPLVGTTLISDSIVAADIEDSTGLVVISGLTVGQSTAFDILMPITNVLAGRSISLTQATITGV